ncbi:MAG TPA: SBBP repeat-containing protein, partial [Chloroflexia bacterium]
MIIFSLLATSLGTSTFAQPANPNGGAEPGQSEHLAKPQPGTDKKPAERQRSRKASPQQKDGPEFQVKRAKDTLGKLPTYFEANVGQEDPSVRYVANMSGAKVFFTGAEIVMAVKEPVRKEPGEDEGQAQARRAKAGSRVLRWSYVGANQSPVIEGTEATSAKINYLRGNDPSKWYRDVSTYKGIGYTGLYQGIRLQYEGLAGQMKATYTVAPGADPRAIRWQYEGADAVTVDAGGNLRVRLAAAPLSAGNAGTSKGLGASAAITVTEQAPITWQEIGGQDVPVTSRYLVAPDGTISFEIGAYDPTHPLVIDPAVEYSTYLGGAGNLDEAFDIAVDGAGNTYITGWTYSQNFPTKNPMKPIETGGIDAFVTKLNSTGSDLVFSTYFGGTMGGSPLLGTSADDAGQGIAVDADANVYLTGWTETSDFPAIPNSNPIQRTFAGGYRDAFVAKISSGGDTIVYSTYLGGSGNGPVDIGDEGYEIALDAPQNPNAYVTGYTISSDFPVTANAYRQTSGGARDAFLSKINLQGTQLLYSTYLGGSTEDEGRGLVVDTAGNAFLAGWTNSTNFDVSVTPAPYSASNQGGYDAFFTKLNTQASGTASLAYSTYLGGSGDEGALVVNAGIGNLVAVDKLGVAYLTGYTKSTNFPITAGALATTNKGGQDAYVAKLDPTKSGLAGLLYSTYMGGTGTDIGNGIAVDEIGNAYIVGKTNSTNFVPLQDPYQAANNGGYDVFVTMLLNSGSSLTLGYSTYLGGSGDDGALDVTVDKLSNAYVTGATKSTNFPTVKPYQANCADGCGVFGGDAFITKIWASYPQARELRCGGSPSQRPTTSIAGFMVNTATGYNCYTSSPIALPDDRLPLMFRPTYNSDMALQTGPMGYGWTHNYNMYIDRDGAGNYLVHEENGSVTTFAADFTAPNRVLATLTRNDLSGSLTLIRTQSGQQFEFETWSGNGIYRLTSARDRSGYSSYVYYDGEDRIDYVDDYNARVLKFTYNATTGLLERVDLKDTVNAATSFLYVTLSYVNGELRTINDVGRKLTQFTYYTGHLLESVQDPTLSTQWNYYGDFSGDKRVISQKDPENNTLDFGYAGSTGSMQARITDTLGLVALHAYQYNMLQTVTENVTKQPAQWTFSYQPGTPWVSSVKDPN